MPPRHSRGNVEEATGRASLRLRREALARDRNTKLTGIQTVNGAMGVDITRGEYRKRNKSRTRSRGRFDGWVDRRSCEKEHTIMTYRRRDCFKKQRVVELNIVERLRQGLKNVCWL